MAEEFTAKFKVDISDLKKNISDATKSIREANATFKAQTAGMDKWADNADGLSEKLKQLDSVLDAQKRILASYKGQLAAQQKAYDENGRRADELRKKLQELSDRGVSKSSEEYKKYKTALQNVTKEQENNEKAVDDLKIAVLNQEAAVKGTEREIRHYKDNLDHLDDSTEEVAKDTKDASEGFTVMKGVLADLASSAIKNAISGLKKLGKEALDVGMNFEKSMSNNAALFQATDEELAKLSETAQHYGETTQFSASEAADALGYMALAGWDADKATKELGGVLKLAAASGMELAESSDMVTDYLSAFSNSEMTAAQFADKLAYAQANSNTTAEQLGQAYKNSAANLNAAGQDVETVTSLLAAMANQGLKGSEAGTALTAMMRDLTKNMGRAQVVSKKFVDGISNDLVYNFEELGGATKEFNSEMHKYLQSEYGLTIEQTEKALNAFLKTAKTGKTTIKDVKKAVDGAIGAVGDFEIGVGDTMITVTDANGNFRDLTDILKEVEKATKKMGKAEKAAALGGVFTADSIKGLNLILNDGIDKAEDFERSLRNCDGAASDMADTMNDNVDGSLKLLRSNIESKMIKVFDAAKGSIKSSVNSISGALDTIDWDAIGKMVGNFAKKVSDLFAYLVKNSSTVIGILKGVGVALGSIFAINKISKFISSLSTLGGAVKNVLSVTKLLNTAWLASPLGLVISAVVGLSGAFIALRKAQEKELQEQYGLNEAQQKTIEKAAEIKQSYDDMDAARKNSMQAIDSEFGYIKELKSEYNKLIDENGKVKKGYEDRAEFILNQLAQSMGVERSEIDKVIEKNGKLGESIDKIIQKKQAEAILQANEAAYTEAIQKRNEAMNAYQQSVTTLGEAEENYKDTVAEVRAEREKISTAMLHASGNLDQYQYQLGQLDKKEQVAKKALEDAKKAVEDSEDAYVGYINTIKNYEGLSASIISGDAKSIESSMQNIQENFVTAKTGTKRTLEEQLANAKKTYEDMKKAAASGMAGVTQEVVNNAADMVLKSNRELKAFEEQHRTTFQTTIADAVAAKDPMEKAGSSVGRAYWTNVASPENIGKTKAAGAELKDNAVSGASDTSGMRKNGENAASGFIAGIRSKIHEAVAAAAELTRQAAAGGAAGQESASPSKLWQDEVGEMAGEGYIAGLNNMIMPAMQAAKNLVTDAIDAAAKQTVRGGGMDFSGFGQGLSRNVASAAGGISKGAAATTRTSTFTQVINSPKPLTRIEIYRQTKNLLNLARMGA